MLDMRLRLPELMLSHKPDPILTAYRLSEASDGVISMTNAHHLVAAKGATARVDMKTLDALCRVFRVTPDKLLTDAPPPDDAPVPKPRAKRKAATKGKATPKAKGRQSRAA